MPLWNWGPGPFTDLAGNARKLRALADDLDRIALGQHPQAADLQSAPTLSDWGLVLSQPTHLVGIVHGHPEIADGRICRTSALVMLDPPAGYARTLSRFYRLGQPRTGGDVQ